MLYNEVKLKLQIKIAIIYEIDTAVNIIWRQIMLLKSQVMSSFFKTSSGLVRVKTRREIFNPTHVCNRYIFQAQATHLATFFGPQNEKRISIFQNPVNCTTEELLLS